MNISDQMEWEKRRCHNLFETIKDVAWEVDRNLQYIYISPLDKIQRGYSPEEIIGAQLIHFITPDKQASVKTEIQNLIEKYQDGQCRSFQISRVDQKCKDGKVIITDIVLSPLYENGEFSGLVGLTRDVTDKIETEAKIKKLNRQLEDTSRKVDELSIKDPLTGAYNRNKFEEILEQEIKRSKRYSHTFSMIILDVDFFKKINEIYGYPAGDAILKEISNIISINLRETDYFFRWGGEEFILLLNGVDIHCCKVAAERIRKSIESYKFSRVGRVTISLGITEFERDDDVESIVIRADRALHKAKDTGRNKVIFM